MAETETVTVTCSDAKAGAEAGRSGGAKMTPGYRPMSWRGIFRMTCFGSIIILVALACLIFGAALGGGFG